VSGNPIERLLDGIETNVSHYLIFAGILDNNAKLLSFRRGKAKFTLPIERHDTLDVQLSLMFSLIRQLEDISGTHKATVTRFASHDIFLFGTNDLHIFVMTSPTSEGQVAKTLADLVAMTKENEPAFEATRPSWRKDQAPSAAMTSTHQDETNNDRQRVLTARSRPEAIAMLQGYLMALEVGSTIQEDVGGYYKIKASESDKFSWSTLEKMNAAFKDKIEIHHIGVDVDGKVIVRISPK
jgi:hypothetical protein